MLIAFTIPHRKVRAAKDRGAIHNSIRVTWLSLIKTDIIDILICRHIYRHV